MNLNINLIHPALFTVISDTELSAQQEVGPTVLKVENQRNISTNNPNAAAYSGFEFT